MVQRLTGGAKNFVDDWRSFPAHSPSKGGTFEIALFLFAVVAIAFTGIQLAACTLALQITRHSGRPPATPSGTAE
jgi:hypothetical protein